MHVFNETHIHIQQIAADNVGIFFAAKNNLQGAIEDDFWLVKHIHGPYGIPDQMRLKKFGTRIPKDYCEHHICL